MIEPVSGISNEQLDRLVDGELSVAQQQELLRRVEHQPDGWRRCALAFLEAQGWKQELTPLCRGGERAAPGGESGTRETDRAEAGRLAVSPTVRTRPAAWLRRHAGTMAAMAASFLLALMVGSVAVPRLRGRVSAPAPQVEEVAVSGVPAPAAPAENRRPAENRPPAAAPWTMVTFSVPDGQQGSFPVRVPAVEREQLDEGWLQSMPQALPEDVLRALQRTGHRVVESRQLLPVPLKDGRRLVVPVDQVDVHYVGNKAYQ